MKPCCRVARPSEAHPGASGTDECLEDGIRVDHRPELRKGSGEGGTANAGDGGDIGSLQLGNGMNDNLRGATSPDPEWARYHDLCDIRADTLQPVEHSGRAVRGDTRRLESRHDGEVLFQRSWVSREDEDLFARSDNAPGTKGRVDTPGTELMKGRLSSSEHTVLGGSELSNGAPGVVEHG